jgi:hypothetical protein
VRTATPAAATASPDVNSTAAMPGGSIVSNIGVR